MAGNLRKNGWLRRSTRYIFRIADQTNCSSGRIYAGYAPLIKTYVSFILAKLRFHRLRPEFNGLFEYEEYVTLKGIDDPNEG